MGIARYRDAETGELIDEPYCVGDKRDYVIERPVGTNAFGEPLWADELPVEISLTQQEAKKLYEKIKDNPDLFALSAKLKGQIWTYKKENHF